MAGPIHIYADGACSGNPGPGGWGAVVLFPEGLVRELGGGERPSTNNRMELTAVIAALSAVRDRPEAAKVFSDSGYVINGITAWVFGWKRKGWRTASGEPVLNRELWERLDDLAQARRGRLEWGHVRGHAGHEVNERCDELAVAFSQGCLPRLYEGPAVGCGYSLLEPGAEHLHAPGGRRAPPSRPRVKGGFYVSLVGGRVERHAAWPECQARVHGVSGARFKKVASADEESEVLRRWGVG